MEKQIELYEIEHSPYCIPVRRVFEALGVPFTRVAVPNWDRSEIIELTQGASYEVPVLKNGNEVIWETSEHSIEIAQYIDRTFAEGRLFPEEAHGFQEILIPYIEGEVESSVFKLTDPKYIADIKNLAARTMTIRHKERKYGRGCVQNWREHEEMIWSEATRHLSRFDAILRYIPYLLGDTPVFADFALFGVVANLTYRGYNEIPKSLKSLIDWHQRLFVFRF
jgi:glutathione S-transferase